MSKIAFIYPGQGAQVCGMGQDFYEQTKEGKETFDLATDILGFSVPELCFTENDRLDITEYTQAAMVTTSIAMTKVLEAQGVKPDVTAGLSLGEYCALYAAGVMSEKDAIATVRQRGILMQQAVPAGQGAMAAVLAMDAAAIEETIADIEGVQIANYNCPGQIVISGEAENITKIMEDLKNVGAKRVLKLNVSGPFHSPMLAQAGEKLKKDLEKVNIKNPHIPYYANYTAELIDKNTSTEYIKSILSKQVSGSVRFEQSVRKLIESGFDRFIEIGPGDTLTGFVKRIAKDMKVEGLVYEKI